MKVLVDVNLSPTWVSFFDEQDVDSIHWTAVGDPRADDATLVEWAREHGYVLFTHDLDFSRIVALSGESGPSVVQVRTEDVLPAAIGRLVVVALGEHAGLLAEGAIVIIDATTTRARILPI